MTDIQTTPDRQTVQKCKDIAMEIAHLNGIKLNPEQPGQFAVKRLVEYPDNRSDQGVFIETLDPVQKDVFEFHNPGRHFN